MTREPNSRVEPARPDGRKPVDRDRSDVLLRLFEGARTSFDKRRAYEWKLSLGIWTAIAAFIALALRGEVRTTLVGELLLLGAAVFVLAVQGFFLHRIKLANDVDDKKARLFEPI